MTELFPDFGAVKAPKAPTPAEIRQLPLAERMRPRAFDGVVGQDAALDGAFPLRTLTVAGRLPSLILWGPPGSGKTTLARVIAHECHAEFTALSAVQAGTKDVRAVIEAAKKTKTRRSILFLDEIHRFNKAQQDVLLPALEDGTLTLLGATTENPSFEVNAALLSRCRVLPLQALSEAALATVVQRACLDHERGLWPTPDVDDGVIALIARLSHGDARQALTVLEIAHETARAEDSQAITAAHVRRGLGDARLAHDKQGDRHYDLISAFIKSMRGSDPHAASYYLARMLEGGEPPEFIARRCVIFASEDIGNADPHALPLAVAASQAVRLLGLPEARYPLSQCATYLASAPKSNAQARALTASQALVERHGPLEVPLPLRNAPTGLMKSLGYGREYRYAHDFPDGITGDDYLPREIRDATLYEPADSGHECAIRERLARWDALKRERRRDAPQADGARDAPDSAQPSRPV